MSRTVDDSENAASIGVVVWGTGNMGRAAIRAVVANPALHLAAVLVNNPDKVGRDAGDLAGMDEVLGVAATNDVDAVLGAAPGAVSASTPGLGSAPGAIAYMASGDIRPDEAAADIARALSAGAVVVSPALYAMYDPESAPAEVREPLEDATTVGSSALFVSGIDPGWGNDILPTLIAGLGSTVDRIVCQEIFDYSTYDQPDAVRYLVGMGQPMDYEPPMVAVGVPTMVWGGQVRLMARALGVELDEIREVLERRELESTVENSMGTFDAGTQGAMRFEIQGIVDGEAVLVVEHVTRIDSACAPEWPTPADGGAGAHRVIIEGSPRIEVTIVASDEGGNRAAGGNATAAGRLINAIPWLRSAPPGIYSGLDVPIEAPTGRIGRTKR
ncbi:MAG TPA: hypothetical protein VL068_08350 [Microthrixaceae bacterium]|nr:hypothetical protein [Microthrixaceae bacterium]